MRRAAVLLGLGALAYEVGKGLAYLLFRLTVQREAAP